MSKTILLTALVAVSAYAIAATAYGFHIHGSAIRGWLEGTNASSELASVGRDRTAASEQLSRAEMLLARHRQTFQAILRERAGIVSGDSDMVIAKKLANHLYQMTLFAGPWRSDLSVEGRYMMSIQKKTYNYCSSLSTMLEWALWLFGIDSRSVAIASKSYFDDVEGDTHVLVEAWITDRAVAIDPTFDTTYSCGDERDLLDVKGMAECVKTGTLTPHYIGEPRPGRRLDQYYIPLSKLLYAVDASAKQQPFGLKPTGKANFYNYETPYPGWLQDMKRQYSERSNSKKS
jgi:hypothetical protein